MKKIKMFDWIAGKWRSTKIFNPNRENPVSISEVMEKVEKLEIEKALLEQKRNLTFAETERLGEIKKELNRLANMDTGERYRKFEYHNKE